MCKMTLTETKLGFLSVNCYLKLTWKLRKLCDSKYRPLVFKYFKKEQ